MLRVLADAGVKNWSSRIRQHSQPRPARTGGFVEAQTGLNAQTFSECADGLRARVQPPARARRFSSPGRSI